MLPMPFPLHSLVHLSNQLLSYINCEGLKLTRTQALSSRGSVSDGRDRLVNNCREEIRALKRPARGTLGIQVGGAVSAQGVGKPRLGHIFRVHHRCPEAATDVKTD